MEIVRVSVYGLLFIFGILLTVKLWYKFSFMGQWTIPIIIALWKVPGPRSIPLLGSFVLFWGTPEEIWISVKNSFMNFPTTCKSILTNSIEEKNHSLFKSTMKKEEISDSTTKNGLQKSVLPLLQVGLRATASARSESEPSNCYESENEACQRRTTSKLTWKFFLLECHKHCSGVVDVLTEEYRKEEPKVLASITKYALNAVQEALTASEPIVDVDSERMRRPNKRFVDSSSRRSVSRRFRLNGRRLYRRGREISEDITYGQYQSISNAN